MGTSEELTCGRWIAEVVAVVYMYEGVIGIVTETAPRPNPYDKMERFSYIPTIRHDQIARAPAYMWKSVCAVA
jgi:hypothetical protein